MQRLHVVGFTKDREGLVLSVRKGTKTGAYSVDVDGQFEEVVAELIKERGGEAEPRIPRAESQLTVREMQQRLRSGQSIHQVARAAGVADEWVARFAVPIQAEQGQVVRQAFTLVLTKQRLGLSAQPLGTSVWWNLQDRSVTLEEDGWDNGWSAALLKDNRWVVKFEYDARKRHNVAEWEVDLRAATLTSRNRLATELGYVESGRRRRPGPPPPVAGGLVTRAQPPVNETPAPAPVVEEGEAVLESNAAPTKRRGAERRGARRPTNKAAASKVAAKKKPATRKPVAKKAPVKKAPVKKAPVKKAPANKITGKRAAPKKSVATRASVNKAVVTKSAPKKSVAKKSATKRPRVATNGPSKASARRVTPPPTVTTVAPVRSVSRPVVAIVSGGTRASEIVSVDQPNLTPAPSPSASKKRRSFLRR